MGEKTQASAPTSTAPPVAASGRPEEQEEKVAGEKPMLSSTEPLSGGLTHRNKSQTAKRIPFLRMEEAKGLAFFSTAHGAHSKREVPDPPPPVIVRIDRPQEVADFAHVYYNKYDRLYKCFFPFCGWAVEDLFDDYDIHLHGRTFLEKVLKYVTWENDYGVRIFAGAWARSYPDRLPFVKSCPYDPDDSLGIVFEVFTGGETHQFPPTFLWNAIAIMRNDLQSRPEAPSVVRETAAMTASSANGGPESRTATSTAQKVDNMDERRRPDDTTGSPAPIEIHIPPPQNHPVAQMPLARGSSNPMTDAPTQLQTPILAHPTVVPPTYAGGQAQGAQAGSLRNPRVRTQRQSSSHHRSGPYPGWAENMPMPPPTGQNRNASISMTMIPSPGPHSVVPVGPPISGGMGQMAPQMGNLPVFPPNVPGGMYPGHMPLGPIPQGPTQYPGLPLGGPNMDLSQQGYQVSLTGPRGMPISEFASNAPYGHVPTMQRHDQPGGSDPRRSGRPERQHALYNPYGAERPEFANIPSQSSNRRASRGGYPTGTVRFRKQSLGAYSRPTVLAGGEQHSMRGGHAEPFSPTNFGLPRDIQPIDPDDPERGCRDDWIGPKNDFVTELIVFDIPHEATDIDVMTFFQKRADVTPTNVKLRTDRYEHPIANVRFARVDDARKGLALHHRHFLGKPVAVRVPERYYSTYRDRQFHQGPQGSRRTSVPLAIPRMTTDNSEVARPAYSPQDARSGPPGQGPWTEKGSITGSPEARKRKKQAKSPTKVAATAENPSSVLEAGVAVTSQLLESETSAEMTVQENPTSQQIEDAVTSPKFEAVPEGEGAQPVNTKRKATSSDETTYHTPPAEKSVSALDAPSTTQQTTVPGEEELPEKSEAAGSVQDALICPSAIVELTADDEQRETIAAVEDPALDEEQQNDSSFHSAKEALSDSSKDEVKDEAKDEVTEEAKDEAKDDDRRDDLKSSEKKVGDGAEKSEKESSQQSAINPTNSTGDNIDTQMFHPDATNSTKPPPTEKKPGAKQTEPLFPFKSKAQIKKEKEQKKKERKKAKTEKPSVTTKTNAQADETEPQTQLPPPAISASNGTKSLQVKVAVPVLKTPSQTPSIESGPVVAVKAPSKTEVASPITIGTEKILDEVRSEDGVSMASSATLKANTPPMSPKHVVTGCPPANMSSAAVPPAAKKAKPKKKKKKPAVVSPEPGETSTAPSIRGAFTEQLNLIDRVKGSEDSVSYYTRPDMTDDGEQKVMSPLVPTAPCSPSSEAGLQLTEPKVTEAELLEDVARFLQERREQFDALPQRVRESLAKRAAAETSESALTANVDEGKRRA